MSGKEKMIQNCFEVEQFAYIKSKGFIKINFFVRCFKKKFDYLILKIYFVLSFKFIKHFNKILTKYTTYYTF